MEKLSEEEINKSLLELPGWEYDGKSIKKIFAAKNYPAAMGFVTATGGICQRKNHHPDYILMKFRDIEVSFSTHSAGGITGKDIEIAKELENLPL